MLRKILNISWKILAGIFVLMMTAWILIHFSPVQTWLVRKATHYLSDELNTKVEVRKVDFSVFKKIILEGVFIEDKNKDTLLYAGRIAVRFNNWFIFKKETKIYEADLEHATFYLHRSDSSWNYRHLTDYFSSDVSAPKKQTSPYPLSLSKIHLSDIHFFMKDEWIGEDIKGYIGQLDMQAKSFDLKKKVIDISSIHIRYPVCTIYEYNGKRPPRKKLTEAEIHADNDTLRNPFMEGWNCDIRKIRLYDGIYSNLMDTLKPDALFDPSHIVFSSINTTFSDIKVKGDSVLASMELSTKERSGFEIKKLTSDINWHARGMEFHKLRIETPFSRIGDFFAMRYLRFNHDMNHFTDHVQLEADFQNSDVDARDIAFFVPALEQISESIELQGKVTGKVNHLSGRNLIVKNGSKTILKGNADIKGLPDLSRLDYDISLEPSILEYKKIARYVPTLQAIKMPHLAALGDCGITGSIKGKKDSLLLDVALSTAIGKLATKAKLYLPSAEKATYSGTLKTDQFNLGTFLRQPALGYITMTSDIKGSGMTDKTIKLDFRNQIASVDVTKKSIRDIKIDGSLAGDQLTFSTISGDADCNLAIASIIHFKNTKSIQYELGGTIHHLDLHKLGLYHSPLSLSGNLDAGFTADQINSFEGVLSVNNLNVSDGINNFPCQQLIIRNEKKDTLRKALRIQSDFLNFSMDGIYSLDKLPALGNQILSVYFPSYFDKEDDVKDLHDFSFELETRNIDELLSLFNLPVHGANESKISGNINTLSNLYQLDAAIPNINIRHVGLEDIRIQSKNNNTEMNLSGNIGTIRLSDSLQIPNTQFLIRGGADTGYISVQTAIAQSFKNADLRSHFEVSKDGILFSFLKSGFFLNEKIWSIEDESDLFLSSKDILSDGIVLTSGNESVKIFTHPSDIGSYNDVTIEIRKLELGELLPFFLKDPVIEGSSTGRIDITDPFGAMNVESKITTEHLRINNDSIGLVPMQLSYKQKDQTLRYTLKSENQRHVFNIKGYTRIAQADSVYTENIIDLNHQSLSLLEPYLEGIISGIKGTATGILKVSGYVNDIQLTGTAKLHDASFTLDYTQCRYIVQPGAAVECTQDKIDFVNMLVKDINGKSASFIGRIYHSFFNDMVFDLHFEAMNRIKGIQVLNTTAKDNALFYGNVTAYANGTITGPASNIKMKISGRPTDSSRLYLPTSDTRVTGTANFIVFRQYGENLKGSTKIQTTSSVNVDLDIIANPYAKVYLILDEITNDIIEGQGNGTINLKVGTNENVSITGNYEITRGKYTFNWQSLFKRPFLINKGMINWTGDPYNARINIDANYLVEQVKLPAELTSGCSNERNNILVVANLSNTLQNPAITFRFELPQGHPCRNNPLTNNGLSQLYNNPDELNRQVISLLLIGSFISNTQNQSFAGGSVGNTFFTSAAGTLSEFLAQQVESGLGAVIRNIPGLKDLKLDPYVTFTPGLITGTQAEGIGFQGTGSFGFTRRLMNGRLLLKAGGSMLVAAGQNNNTVQNNRQLTPDISIEWLITPDGKLRLIGFYRTIFDIQRRNDRTGMSFSYLKEFDKIW